MKISDLRPEFPSSKYVRWYGIYRWAGRTDAFLEDLRSYLTRNSLTDAICGVRLERRARGEFYFALTFETPQLFEIPDDVADKLEGVTLFRSFVGQEHDLSDLKRLFSAEVDVTALGHCLAYRRLKDEAASDPFEVPLNDDVDEMPESTHGAAERLLWYLSAVGHGPWQLLRASCSALGSSDSGAIARIARHLRLLGHLELSADGDRWGVTSPAIVEVPQCDGENLRFRTGARNSFTDGERRPQPHAPDMVTAVDDVTSEVLEHPAADVLTHLPTIGEFAGALQPVGGVSTTAHTLRRHDGLGFVEIVFDGQPGMYEVAARDDRTMTLFFDGAQWRRGDWYGLRYLSLQAAGVLTPARYDRRTWRLAIPRDQRPPEVFERALVLCSGQVPQRESDWWVYNNIDPAFADRWSDRIAMPLSVEHA